MPTALVIHGHFYQPPRENPWTDMVDREPSAHPYHDWNERIYHESYRANAFARILDSYGRVVRILSTYEALNFNFGPTLLSWLEKHHPHTYRRILESDRVSAKARGGHGNAIAQGYNHTILPLCNERDLRTQIRWGMADFRHRFGREPESLWMPETACNGAVLDAMIDEGLRYAILSPYQVERVRPLGGGEWKSVADGTVDPGVPYRRFHGDGSGRSIDLFFYDGPISRSIAFEGALATSQALVDRFARSHGGDGRIVHVATDGESYGHHTKFGELSLAHALDHEAQARGFWVTNYAEYLDHHPPTMEAEIKAGPNGEGTAWSCAHGVGRWYRDCGCEGGAREGWNQQWRTPLRESLDFLSDVAASIFQSEGAELFQDPWAARDAYIELLLDRERSRDEFLVRHSGRQLKERERERALILLEMQRHAMLMYTSCGWFFADISGIETVQVMKYAGRVLDLIGELGHSPPTERFLDRLAAARSNLPEMGNGAEVFRRFVEPCRTTPQEVAAHLAISSLVDHKEDPTGEAAGYSYRRRDFRRKRQGRLTLATGRLALESSATGRQVDLAFSAMHFGGIDFYCVLQPFPGRQPFRDAVQKVWELFPATSLPTILRVAREQFGPEEYGLEHVLPAGRMQISEMVFGDLVERFAHQYALLYEDSHRLLDMLQGAGFELPPELLAAAEFTLGRRLETELRAFQKTNNPAAYQKAVEIADEIRRRGYRVDRTISRDAFGDMVTEAVGALLSQPGPERMRPLRSLLDLGQRLAFEPNLHRAQELLCEYGAGALERAMLDDLGRRLGLAPECFAPRTGTPAPRPTAGALSEATS